MDNLNITVADLIKLFEAIPEKHLPVIVDGCDCQDFAGGVHVFGDGVHILRDDQMWQFEDPED